MHGGLGTAVVDSKFSCFSIQMEYGWRRLNRLKVDAAVTTTIPFCELIKILFQYVIDDF